MKSRRSLLGAALLVLAGGAAGVSGPALAAEPGTSAQELVQELRPLLDKAEKERLVDPWFLRDLRAVVDRYDNPWRRSLLSDDFSQRGPEPAPPWKVVAGDFRLDWRYGLRAVVEPRVQTRAPAPDNTQSGGTQSGGGQPGGAAQQLIGTLLKQALEGQQGGSGQQAGGSQPAPADPDPDPGYAAVIAPVAISNAFAIEAELTERPIAAAGASRLELGPYQGQDAEAGYRLVYLQSGAKGTPTIQLVQRSGSGTASTLQIAQGTVDLLDGEVHSLRWTRDRAGRMAVTVDGAALFEVVDRSFAEPFDGFAVVNRAGDFALRRLSILGTPQ